MQHALDEDLDEEEAGEITHEYTLSERTELRLECTKPCDVFLELLEGSAEIFGAELQLGSKINVKGLKFAVFTWRGCRLQVEGSPALSYQASETPMASYLDLHNRLNKQREAAKAAASAAAGGQTAGTPPGTPPPGTVGVGPRVIIVGPTDSGKSSLTRMLLNWGVRSGWEPTFVDLDVVPVEVPLDPEQGAAGLDLPLVLFYGHASPRDNPELYKFLIDRLAAILDQRAASNAPAAAAGLVINTVGWTDGLGYELQLHAIQALKASVVVVLEQDRLHSRLQMELQGRGIEVVKLQKSGGVVKREPDERRAARDANVHSYFYGRQGNLMPVTQVVRADTLKVFRVGGGPRAPSSALPIGAVASAPDPLRVVHAPVTAELVQSLLAVSHAETPDQVLTCNIAGFILVKEVDTIRNTVTFVAPCPGPLPGRYLLSGSLRSAMD